MVSITFWRLFQTAPTIAFSFLAYGRWTVDAYIRSGLARLGRDDWPAPKRWSELNVNSGLAVEPSVVWPTELMMWTAPAWAFRLYG
jgi:hypothetical protein